ncbi:MAG: acetate--CoA ligase family protein, partial [Ilumatobacteraceae bacterium]
DDDVDVDALVAHARRNGLRIIGPSSMGIASPLDAVSLQAALVHVDLPPGRVAVSMQSGTLASSLLRLAGRLQLGLSWFVSLGDKRDVSANDLLQFWEDDDATSVIALYTESLGNPRKFARITRRVSASKPIVAVRTGAAVVGAANAALYRQTGVIEVPTVTALLDTVRVLATQPLMGGDRVTIVSNAASPAVLAAATLEAAGVRVVAPPLPLDWRSSDDDMGAAVGAALDDPGVDAVMVIHAPPTIAGIGGPIACIEGAVAERSAAKPVVAVMLGSEDGPLGPGSDIPAFAFPEQAAAALGRLSAYSTWRSTEAVDEPESDMSSTIDPAAAGAVIEQHLASGSMPPEGIRELLASYGVDMPVTHLVAVDRAVGIADEMGYPVAMKALHRRVGRSVEAGIALDLTESSDVDAAAASMREHLGDDARQVYVQPMVPPGVDLRVRITVDDRIGPVITVGLGGVQADAIGDESSRLAPISPTVARSLVAGTRAASVIDDDDLDVVAALISRVAQLASDHPQIAELDLNPVIIGVDGCRVVDASVTLRQPSRGEHAVRRLE